MSENNAEIQSAEQIQSAEVPKKRVRIGFVFLSIVPVAVLIGIQTITQIPFLVISAVDLATNNTSLSPLEVSEKLLTTFNEKYAVWAYLLYSVAALLVFGIWYFKGFVKNHPKVRLKEIFGVKSIFASIGMVIGLQFAITAAFVLAFRFLPKIMNDYVELMKSAGLMDNIFVTILYAIILGPIVEELCIRGVCFGFLEKSGIKPALMILISGILFGVMHLNLVQGVYASILGFFLGFMRYKYRSIKLTIFIHILFNIMGTYGDTLMEKIIPNDGIKLILGGVALFVLVFATALVNSDKKAYKAAD